MSNRRRHKSQSAAKPKSDGADPSGRSASEDTPRSEGTLAAGHANGSRPSQPSALQRILLAAAVGLEIVWILFLVILAVIR